MNSLFPAVSCLSRAEKPNASATMSTNLQEIMPQTSSTTSVSANQQPEPQAAHVSGNHLNWPASATYAMFEYLVKARQTCAKFQELNNESVFHPSIPLL
jgi:hypothetical protein